MFEPAHKRNQELRELCEAYFLCGEGKDEETARDLTQEFFARLLAGGGFGHLEPGRSRFRSYLLGALKHFLADHKKQALRLKRGGGAPVQSLDAPADSANQTAFELQVEDPSALPPDKFFDREWALTVMQRSLSALQREFADSSKARQFEVLKPLLMGSTEALSHKEAATEGAVKLAIHRLRKRTELSHTVETPAEIEEELRYFVEVLAEG
jgi:RNA polymerase sigma-70 factor (ECF subfamily)